jgi:hypothetical protein
VFGGNDEQGKQICSKLLLLMRLIRFFAILPEKSVSEARRCLQNLLLYGIASSDAHSSAVLAYQRS